MNLESFYETLKFAIEVDVRLRLQTSLEAIRDSLNNLVASPAHPQQQSSLASTLKTFCAAAEELGEALPPSQASLIAEAGGAEFFSPSIGEKVKASVATNAMTPSVARDFVRDLADRRSSFLTTLEQTLSGLTTLGVTAQELAPGAASMAFVIPREIFGNELEPFAKELVFINQFVRHFNEAVTGEPIPVYLEGSSSSIPTVALAANPKITESIAKVVEHFLQEWGKADKVRRIRQELAEMGLKKQTFDELTEQIRNSVDQVVEDSVESTVSSFKHDPARKHYLQSALRRDIRRLFGQIERGLVVQFRARFSTDLDQDDRSALDAIDHLSRKLQFPAAAAEPILLTRGQVLEGDFEPVTINRMTASAPPPASNGTRSSPPPAATVSIGGGLWGRRRTDRQE